MSDFDWALEHLKKVIQKQYGGSKKHMSPDDIERLLTLLERIATALEKWQPGRVN
jgi:hypothetical protein